MTAQPKAICHLDRIGPDKRSNRHVGICRKPDSVGTTCPVTAFDALQATQPCACLLFHQAEVTQDYNLVLAYMIPMTVAATATPTATPIPIFAPVDNPGP